MECQDSVYLLTDQTWQCTPVAETLQKNFCFWKFGQNGFNSVDKYNLDVCIDVLMVLKHFQRVNFDIKDNLKINI